jgi:hypothetical protein
MAVFARVAASGHTRTKLPVRAWYLMGKFFLAIISLGLAVLIAFFVFAAFTL